MSAATTPRPCPSGSVKPAAWVTSTKRPRSFRKDVVDGPLVLGGITVETFPALVLADHGVVRVPSDIMTDVKVEVAIVVEVGKR